MINIGPSKMVNTLSHLKNPAAVLPVLIVEVFTTAGRTHQGYKRGGETEAKERLLEEGSSAAVWLFGAKMLNKLGDYFGKRFLGLEHLDTDVGKDALRQPFDTVFNGLPEKLKNKTAVFKFAKIFGSVAIATTTVGFVIPKIKQNMTKEAQKKKALKQVEILSSAMPPSVSNIDNYVKSVSLKKDTSFKGLIDKLLTASHNVENNNVWRLISTDTGMIAGRTLSSRNKVEAREFLFRDTASIYFYMFAIPHTVKFLNKLTKNIDIHPKALMGLQKHLSEYIPNSKEGISPEAFSNLIFGNKIQHDIPKAAFKNQVATLESLRPFIPANLMQKASKMAELQPETIKGFLLSSQQVDDVFNTGIISDPKFLKEALSEATYGALTNPKKFVEKSKVEQIRKSISDFAEYIYNYAVENKKQINTDLIDELTKKNISRSMLYRVAGFAVAILGLGVIIPKVKDFITKKTTGRDEFPGTADYSQNTTL